METVGLREANLHFAKYIKKVRGGAEIILTDRGTPVAIIKPLAAAASTLEEKLGELETAGMLHRAVISSSLLLTESLSALKRRHSSRELSKQQFRGLVRQVSADISAIDSMPISDLHLRRAETVVLKTASGTLDALHIAAALLFQEMTGLRVPFVTADRRQAQSAGEVVTV